MSSLGVFYFVNVALLLLSYISQVFLYFSSLSPLHFLVEFFYYSSSLIYYRVFLLLLKPAEYFILLCYFIAGIPSCFLYDCLVLLYFYNIFPHVFIMIILNLVH